MDTVKNFLNKNVNSINPNKLPGSFRDIFDNITWTVVLVATLFVLILVYLSTRTFFTDNRINSLKKEMKNRPKLQGVEVKSESGQEEEFDEIDIKEHRLIDIQIAASAKSYLIGRQLFDYASPEMVIQCLKMGAKYIELDVFLNRNRQVIVSNGLSSGNWKLNFNQIKFEDMCQRLAATLFNPDELGNANDPMILFLNLNLKKSDMETVFQAIQFNFKDNLAPAKYSIKGGEDILQAPLQELLGKLIIMTSGPIGDTSLDQVVHLRIGDRLQRIYFTDLVKKDRREMILYNKYHLTIVVPPVGIRSINYNPETALDYGCQIVAMHYQRNDDFLQNYLSHFREKSFRIKPFEFTRFHDIPQKGYDQSKIAYYNTDMLGDQLRVNPDNVIFPAYDSKFCCQTNLDDSMYDLKKLKEKICKSKESYKFETNNKCTNDEGEETPVVISDYGFNAIRIKLQKLNIAEHPDIVDIEKLGEKGDPELDFYIQKHVFLEDSKNLIESKLDLIYFILTKQLKKALHQERTKLFMTDYEDKCIDLQENQCVEEPICYVDRSEKKKECNPDTDRVPFPQYCLPRYIVGNRNQCFDDEYEGADKKKFGAISNESIRSQYHQLMTGSSPFTGNWSSIGGIIEIPDTFNPYCEFKFITEADQKEYTMYLVKEDGSNIEIDKFQEMDSSQKGLRAKGTFVDRKLREVELRNNEPQLPYHGFADMKIIDAEDSTIDKCFNTNFSATKFLGIYKYSDIFSTKGDKYKKNYLLNSEEEYLGTNKPNNYCYRMENVECNRQLQGIFGRLPEASFSELVPQISDFSKNDLSPIEGFSSGDNLREGFGNMGQDIETFENPYDPEVINPLTLTGEVTLEFDAEEMALSENGAPAASLLEGILDEAQKSASASAKNRNSLQKSGNANLENQIQKGKEDLDLNLNNNDNTDLNNLMNESAGLYAKCIQENGEWKFQFNPGSTLIGTFYEPLFNKKCREYGEKLKAEQTKNLGEIDKLNLSEISKYKLKENLKEKDINLTDKNLNRIKRLIGKNPKKLDTTLGKLVNKMSAEQIDTKNMYQTKKSPDGQNIVDTIRHKKHEPDKGIYPLCLKRYKYDEERCFRPKNPDKKLKCPPSECYDAVLVIGSCSLNSYDTDPFYFETYTHFKIQPHPDNKNRRIIYFNYQEDARNCEKNLDYFSSTIERKQLQHEIAMLTARLQTYTNQEVELTEEQQQEYNKLEADIAKLENQKGEFTPPPGESRVDQHAETVKLADDLKKKTKRYNNFKIDIKRKEIKRMEKKIQENKDILNGASQEIKKKEESGEFYSISKKMCLKYGFRGSSVLVKLLYEDDRRNLTKGFKSDWVIQKYLDESGKHTGQYKIRADIGGTLFNLSQKPVPITPQGPAAAFFPIIQPNPKLEHQLWVIKEVGDLNNPRDIGETNEEAEQKEQIQKDRDDFNKELDAKHQQQMTGLGTGKPKPPY